MVVAGVLNDDKCDDNKNTSYFHKVSVQLVERSPCEVITQSRKWGLGEGILLWVLLWFLWVP